MMRPRMADAALRAFETEETSDGVSRMPSVARPSVKSRTDRVRPSELTVS